MSLNQEERSAIVTYRLEKANRALAQAKANLPLQAWEVIANRVYYAAYYAISALLIADGHPAVKGWKSRLSAAKVDKRPVCGKDKTLAYFFSNFCPTNPITGFTCNQVEVFHDGRCGLEVIVIHLGNGQTEIVELVVAVVETR